LKPNSELALVLKYYIAPITKYQFPDLLPIQTSASPGYHITDGNNYMEAMQAGVKKIAAIA
jgi:hypothetical protein